MKLSIIKSSELAAWQCRDFQLTLAAVVATPPRYNKRKLQHHYEEEMFPWHFWCEAREPSQQDGQHPGGALGPPQAWQQSQSQPRFGEEGKGSSRRGFCARRRKRTLLRQENTQGTTAGGRGTPNTPFLARTTTTASTPTPAWDPSTSTSWPAAILWFYLERGPGIGPEKGPGPLVSGRTVKYSRHNQ